MSTAEPTPPPGVRDPWKGYRGIRAGVLVLEFIVVALALPVVAKLGDGLSSVSGVLVGSLAVAMLGAAFLQRKPWGMSLALILQVALVACWFIQPVIGVTGVLFGVVWGYLLWVRRDVARRMREGRLADQRAQESE